MFEYLYDHSHQRGVSGETVTTTARVINGAVLVVTRLHRAVKQTYETSWQSQKKSTSTLYADHLDSDHPNPRGEFTAIDRLAKAAVLWPPSS